MAAYTPTVWVNNQAPALSAANLNKLTDELKAQAVALSLPVTLPTWADGVAPALTDATPLNQLEGVCSAVAASLGLSYTPTTWEVGWTPARNAARFNKLEQQASTNRIALDGSSPSHSWWSEASPINTPIGANPTVVYPYDLRSYTGGIGVNSYGWGVAIFRDTSGTRRTLINPDGWKLDNVPLPAQWTAYYNAMVSISDTEHHAVIVDSDRIFNIYGGNAAFTSMGAAGCMRAQTVSSGFWRNDLGPWLGRSSGFCSATGAIIKSELDAGQCNHALAAGWPSGSIRNTYVTPATSSDGTGGSSMPPMGSRIQLDPTLSDAQVLAMGITSYWLPVVHALQTYGAFICESTDWMTLYAESWNDAGTTNLNSSAGWYPNSQALLQYMRIVGPPTAPVYDDRTVFGQPHM